MDPRPAPLVGGLPKKWPRSHGHLQASEETLAPICSYLLSSKTYQGAENFSYPNHIFVFRLEDFPLSDPSFAGEPIDNHAE
jgi:hypothetical protein